MDGDPLLAAARVTASGEMPDDPSGQRQRIADTVTSVLGRLLPAGRTFAPSAPLAGLGLDSLTTIRFWLEIQREFGTELPATWLGDCADLAELTDRVTAELAAAHTGAGALAGTVAGAAPGQMTGSVAGDVPAPAGPDTAAGTPQADPGQRYQPFPLTPLQQAYIVAKQRELSTDAAGCHLYREFEMDGLDTGRLRHAWQRLVDHHDMLRAI